jgi:hypothetical protein
MKVNFGKASDMKYKPLNVITLDSGAVVYSAEFKTAAEYEAAKRPSFEAMEAMRQVRRDRIMANLSAKLKQVERKPIFDRRQVVNTPSVFGMMVAAELQKAGL